MPATFAADTQLTLAVPVGGSAADAITVRDPGPHDLVMGAPSALVSPLAVSPATGFTVAGQPAPTSQQLTITCSPTDTSTSTQTLTLATNDPLQPTVSYAITCTGYVPAGGSGTGGGTGATTPELPSGGLLGIGTLALLAIRCRLRRRRFLA
jgi:hypothetical protein